MKPPPFRYHAPTTLIEAANLVATLENARVLAGGQSFMPMLNMRFVTPDHIVDLNRVQSFAACVEHEGELLIGAMTRQRDLELSPLVADLCPLLSEALTFVGHTPTRNRGTIGGSLCHLDPAAEIVCVAAALDATIEAQSTRGERAIPFAAFPAGYMTPAIESDELLSAVRLPIWPRATGHAFVEFARRHGDFAIVSTAALMLLDDEGRISRVSLALGGIGAAPLRMGEIEAQLAGARPSASLFDEASRACESIAVADDPYVPASYRKKLSGTLARRALSLACERAVGKSLLRKST